MSELQKRFSPNLPKVPVSLLQKALNLYNDGGEVGSYEKIIAACEEAVTVWPLPSGSRRFLALGTRFVRLHEILYREEHRARILKEKQFPFAWVKIAATAPVTFGNGFDPSLFTWPIRGAKQ